MIAKLLKLVNSARDKKDSLLKYGALIVTNSSVCFEVRNLYYGMKIYLPRESYPELVNGTFMVDIEKLTKLYASMPDATLESYQGGVIVKDYKSKVHLNHIDEEMFSSLFAGFTPELPIDLDYSTFSKALKLSQNYALEKEDSSIFAGIHIQDGTFYATNKVILSRYETDLDLSGYTIPSCMVGVIQGLKGVKELAITRENSKRVMLWANLEDGITIEYIYATYTSKYPTSIYELYKRSFPKQVDFDTKQFKEALKVNIIATGSDYVKFNDLGGCFDFIGESEAANVNVKVDYSGSNFETIAFNTGIVKKLVNSMKSSAASIGMVSPADPTLWQFSDNHKVVAMPIIIR